MLGAWLWAVVLWHCCINALFAVTSQRHACCQHLSVVIVWWLVKGRRLGLSRGAAAVCGMHLVRGQLSACLVRGQLLVVRRWC